ncbi:Rhodanese-like protein [Stanieria cyanosphaera PCC 7437]|uniref:Rhodanese-like protein n=1 Tax=Stanieria cyanosphaera (strain ATCC 29371 / PCC 7437) TaxID=111780 RepID=K9XPD1_STAC7|nr:MBL fold metallo-hydrolase [Stanieria cyanosphaera]AFZ33906.1 Rhodanese-like protein [Stanieria cyanosphaera PCC 7437]
MALILEQINIEGIAQLSYLIGDDQAGVVAVIDPRRDVDVYLQKARALGVRITQIIESHIHADFVSGSHELQARIGAPIYVGKSDDYKFEAQQLTEGDELHLGNVTLRVLHTPGHTPEHISLLVFDSQQGTEPFGIFTGDTLFNLDVGRPDLVGAGTEKDLAAKLYHSLFDKILPLGDRLEVYPCHGAGSSCGKSIGDRRQTTIGNERVFSDAFKQRTEAEFVEWILSDLPEPPTHYRRLKKINAQGAKVMGCVPTLQPLSVEEFQGKMAEQNVVVIDTRSILAFGGGHIPGAINISLLPAFPNWVGWMIDPEKEILLVIESQRDLCLITEQLFRLGYDNLAGYLHNGMTSWQNAGLPLQRIEELTVQELSQHTNDSEITILDVRSDSEYQNGFIPGAKHIYLPHLEEHLEKLEPNQKIAVYCGTGYRASIAASLLQKHGFERVINIPGSWKAWKNANLPVQKPR